MRIGFNPAKANTSENILKTHRVIMSVYLPNLTDPYFKEGLDVLKRSLSSLYETIDKEFTNITVVADGCCDEVISFLKSQRFLDKLVINFLNKGKVYSVITEAKASYESLITITDADVFFHKGWIETSVRIFEKANRVSTVSPLPVIQHAIHYNSSLFWDKFLFGSLKYGLIAKKKDTSYYIKGLGNTSLFSRNKKESWADKHYFIENPVKAIAGASHFCATYRSELFVGITDFPKYKFKNDFELNFLDKPSDAKGYYRLSTVQAYVYHMGNNLDDDFDNHHPTYSNLDLSSIRLPKLSANKIPYGLRVFFFKFLRKFDYV